jgi:hypothetical protein
MAECHIAAQPPAINRTAMIAAMRALDKAIPVFIVLA